MRKRRFEVAQLGRVPSFEFVKIAVRNLSLGRHIPRVGIAHVSLPPNYTHVPVYHRRTREWLMILKGTGKGVIGGRTVLFKPGTIVYMPPGVLHKMSTGRRRMDVIVLFWPPLDVRAKGADICHPPRGR